MWDTHSNPTLQGSVAEATRIIRGPRLPHNTLVLSLGCWDITSVSIWDFMSDILLIFHIQLVGCIDTPTIICIVSKQSAFIRIATMATANFQISLRPHGTNGKTCPRISKCAVTRLRNTLWEWLCVFQGSIGVTTLFKPTEEFECGLAHSLHITVYLFQVIQFMTCMFAIWWSTAASCFLYPQALPFRQDSFLSSCPPLPRQCGPPLSLSSWLI